MGRISTERANRIYYEAKKLKASMTEEDKAKRKEAQRYAPSGTSGRSAETTSTAPSSSPKANATYVPMDTADNQYAQALAAFNPGGTFVPRAAQEEIAARKAANRSRYMDALDTSTRAGVAAAGSGTVRSVMNTDETVAVRNEWAKKAAQYEADRQSAGREFRSARGSDEYRDRVGGFDSSAIPYGANNTGRIRYALDDDFRARLDTTNQGLGLLDPTYENLKYLNDFEKNDLANLVAQGDYERANEYLDHLQPELNARMQGNVSAANKKLAEEQPVAGVLANIVGTREAGMALLPTIQGAINEEMGIYKPVDTNSSAFRAAHLLRDTTEGVGNAAYNAAGGGIAGDTARFLAEAGLSAAQNASMLPMGPTAPLVFMGSMAAGQSALDTLENGGTAQDALKVAAASAIIESATEKIGIDNFFRISRLGKKGIQQLLKDYKLGKPLVNNIKSFAGDLGTQMAAEGAEEMIAEVAGNLADTAIRGDNGQYAQLVQNYMANGMSEEQAKARAFTDMYIDNVLKAGAQGALAGGMLGVGGATIGTRYNNEVTAVGAQLAELDITPEQLISAVQQSGSKDAQDFARELSRKLVLGQEVTLADMGQLHLLSNNYITSKDYEAVQKAAIAEEEEARNAGGNVRGSEQNLRGSEAAAGVQQNAGNAAGAQQGEPLQRSQNPLVGTQNVTNAQTGAVDVASKATNNTESIEPTAGQVNEEAPSAQAPQTTENAPEEARQPTTYEQGAQVQTPQGEGTVVMTADNTVAVRLANGTTEIFKTADLSSAQANANANTALPQSSAAQTATGNTAANAEANEANAEGRSETAAQSKTVAETSWENIQKIVQTKAKGGLSQKDEYTMNSAGRRAFDRIGRALGVEIHFVDRIVNEEGEANGLYQNGHIFIARNAENPYHVVLAHEITHHFEKTAPDVYEKFKGAALKMNPGLVEKYMAMWGYDEATAEFEVAADFAGELLEKESTVKRVIKEDISAARGFHRAMNAVFDKVRGDDTKGLTEEEKKLDAQLDAARGMWRRCLRETRDEKAEGGESRAQFSRKGTDSLQKELNVARTELEKLETASEKITVPVYEGEKYIETRPDGRRRWTKDISKATRMTERNREKLATFADGVKQIGERETERAKPAPYSEIKRARDRIAALEKEIRAAERGYNSAAEAREAESKTAAVRTQKELATFRDSFFNKKARKGEPFYDDKGNTSYQSMARTIAAEAKRQGAEEVHHSAKSGSKFATSIYLKKGDYEIRISDHSLPPTDERESRNFKSRWNDEFILDASERSALAWMVKTQADLTRLVAGMFDRNTNTHELIDRAYDNWLDNIHSGNQAQMSRKEAGEALASVNVAVDEKSESGYALQPQAQMLMQFSRKTFKASDYSPDSPNFKAAVTALATQLEVSEEDAERFILDVNSVAATIAQDPARLDYVSAEGEGRSAFVSNAEYGGSIDFSTICPKRRMYMGTVEAIQKAMPDKVLSSDDILKIRNMMKDKGYQVACGFCYVEGSRAKLGYYTNQFRKELRDAGEEYVPTQAELMNIESLDRIRREHHDVYEKYLKFMNSLAQRKPKLFQPATEYNGEIIDKFGKDRDKAKVADKNWFGGLRIFSFSDFEAIHMIDMMQVVLDMASVGLAGQAYTKQPDFARVFGGTGIKINLSLVANGVDENGRLTFDGVEGMKIEDAMEIRDMYPDNVGTIVVTFTEAQLKAAMADDRIDFIIPFHRSQWTKKQYGRLGLPADTKDMTYWQNERYFKGKAPTRVNKNGKTVREKAKNFMPNTYWNFKKDGKTNAEAYLKMCAEANKKPKFWNLLVDNKDGSYSLQPDGSTDGYWKLLGDFKMYNHKTGKGVPQKPVKPAFNMDEANRVMSEYKGGHESFPVAQDVVDEFVQKNGGAQMSRKLTPEQRKLDEDYEAAVERGDMETAQRMVDEAAKRAGYDTPKLYHGTRAFGFTRFDKDKANDSISTFATDNPRTAETYSGETQRKRIKDRTKIDVDSLRGEELLREAKKQLKAYANFELVTNEARNALAEETRDEISYIATEGARFVNKNEDAFNDEQRKLLDRALNAISSLSVAKSEEAVEKAWYAFDDALWDLKWSDEDGSACQRFLDNFPLHSLHVARNQLDDLLYQGDLFYRPTESSSRYVFDAQLALELNAELHKGIYELYGKSGKQLVVNADGANWSQIAPPEELHLYGPQNTRAIATAAKAHDYDSVLFKNVRDNGGETPYNGESNVYIFFNPSVLKSADPVTYDDNGKLIPLSERFNEEKDDIRYSRKGQDAAMRRANRLARENARLKGQFKLTKGVKLRESDIRKVTRDLLKDYTSSMDAKVLEMGLGGLYEQIINETDDERNLALVREYAEHLAKRLVDDALVDANDYNKDAFQNVKSFVTKENALAIPDDVDAEWLNEFRDKHKGRIGMKRKGRSVAEAYKELSEEFPIFFPEDTSDTKSQLETIGDVLESLDAIFINPHSNALEDAYAEATIDIMNRVAEVREEKARTPAEEAARRERGIADARLREQQAQSEERLAAAIADTQSKAEAAEIANRIEDAKKYRERIAKLEARLNKFKEENKGLKGEARQTQKDIREADTYYRQAAQEALREAKAQKREALQELKDKYKAKTAEARERQNARELRRKIEKHTGELYKKLSKPTNEKHINEDVRPAAALLISLINQESLYTTDYQTGKPVRPGTPPRLTDNGLPAVRIANKRTEAARKMRKAAEEIFSGEDNYLLIYDPELMENLAIMEDWSDKPLATMSSAELQVVWDAVRGVKHMITQSRKVFNEGRQWEIGTLASGLVRDVDLNNPRRTIKYGAAASVDKLLNIDQLTPQAFFHRFGEGGDRLFRMLRRSQDKYVRIIADIQSRTAEVIKDIDIDKLNKDIATYKVKGGDVTLSRAQVLLLYASIKREQAAGHILGGGIKAKPLKGKGLYETKQLLPVEVTQEDLDKMFEEAKLTEAEKKAADGLVNIMSTVLAEYGNEASLRTYGYAKFREGWYVPIETDPTSNKTDNNDPLFKQFTAAASIAGRGFAKQTKEGAKNAIMVGSLFDVYAKHVNDMAMYAAYVETLENMRRIRNFKFEDGTKTQNYIEALLTKAGVAYWDKLIRDINGGERLNNDDFSFDRFVGAYKAAAVSANIRVILQQPTSIIRAAAEINPAYLIAAMRKIPKRHEWERIKKNAAIAQWKDWGYFDINTGRQMQDVVLGTDSLFEKFKQAGMRPMSGADSFAWTLLYHACEDEAKAKGLRPGSAAFDSFVASRFSDIIDKTQVVDGVLQRSQIMRSTNAVTKMATSFMAEPTKTYNMFLSAVWDWRHAKSKTEKQAARKKLGFTVAALVVSFLVNAAAQSLIDALRDDDRDKEFLDKFWDAYLGRPEEDDKNKAVTVMGGNLWTAFNPVTYIPFFKDIVSLVQGFDTKRMDMESIGRVIDAAEQALAAARGEGKQTAFARAFALASEVSRAFGLPLANIKRDSVAVLNTIAQEKKDYDMMYKVDRAFYKLDKNVSRYVDIMLKAHDAGDTETEKRITDDLHAAGVDDKKIKDAADKIRVKQQGLDSVTELKDRYRPYEEAEEYGRLESYAKSTSTYKSANAKERSKYEALLNDALANNSDAQKRHEKAQKAGVSDNLYMEALVAAQIADRTEGNNNWDKSSKPSQPEAEAAIDRLARDHALSQTQKYNLWMSLTGAKTDKNNPYK